jgi:hypothetical protein
MTTLFGSILGFFIGIPLGALIVKYGTQFFLKDRIEFWNCVIAVLTSTLACSLFALVFYFWFGTSRGLGLLATIIFLVGIYFIQAGIYGKIILRSNGYSIGLKNGFMVSVYQLLTVYFSSYAIQTITSI